MDLSADFGTFRTGMNKAENNSLFSWLRVFSEAECQQIIDYCLSYGISKKGTVHGPDKSSGGDIRVCTEYLADLRGISFSDGLNVTGRLYEAFNRGNFIGLSYEEIPSIRMLEYRQGGKYARHTDWSSGAGINRKLSMSVQLSKSESYEGGDVVIHAGPDEVEISREAGVASIWPSWTLHEVKPITSGVRYCLVAWAHGQPYR